LILTFFFAIIANIAKRFKGQPVFSTFEQGRAENTADILFPSAGNIFLASQKSGFLPDTRVYAGHLLRLSSPSAASASASLDMLV
jgi:hypothetical protein